MADWKCVRCCEPLDLRGDCAECGLCPTCCLCKARALVAEALGPAEVYFLPDGTARTAHGDAVPEPIMGRGYYRYVTGPLTDHRVHETNLANPCGKPGKTLTVPQGTYLVPVINRPGQYQVVEGKPRAVRVPRPDSRCLDPNCPLCRPREEDPPSKKLSLAHARLEAGEVLEVRDWTDKGGRYTVITVREEFPTGLSGGGAEETAQRYQAWAPAAVQELDPGYSPGAVLGDLHWYQAVVRGEGE